MYDGPAHSDFVNSVPLSIAATEATADLRVSKFEIDIDNVPASFSNHIARILSTSVCS